LPLRLHLPASAGDGSPGCPEFLIDRRCRLANMRVAPPASPSVSPTTRSTGCPASWIFRHRLVVPPGCPGFWLPPVCQWRFSGLPRILSPLATPMDCSPSCLEFQVLRRRPPASLRVTPDPCLWAIRRCFLGLPRLRIHGWVDDESLSRSRTLHPRLAPRMNLRVQSGPAIPAWLSTLSQSFSVLHHR